MEGTAKISKAEIYAIHYMDNGGKLKDFPKRHKELYGAIEKEEQRRLIVDIRYKMLKDPTLKNKIYKKFNITSKTEINPIEIYSHLKTLTNNQLLSYLNTRK